jgi:hypothetical protein
VTRACPGGSTAPPALRFACQLRALRSARVPPMDDYLDKPFHPSLVTATEGASPSCRQGSSSGYRLTMSIE